MDLFLPSCVGVLRGVFISGLRWKGYVYGCTSAICEDMGQCTCSIEEKDLEGGGDSMSSVRRFLFVSRVGFGSRLMYT